MVVDVHGQRAEGPIVVAVAWTGDGAAAAGSGRQRTGKFDQLGGGEVGRLAAARTHQCRRTAARLGHGGPELGVDDQVEDEVEGDRPIPYLVSGMAGKKDRGGKGSNGDRKMYGK